MKQKTFLLIALVTMMVSGFSSASANCPAEMDYEFRKLHSADKINICDYDNAKAYLFVNTASHCGFTPQFTELEALHQAYADRGLVVIGFPSNDFRQEASDESKTAEVCYINYGVTFTMTETISVRGGSAHPLFKMISDKSQQPAWNFNKYLVDPETLEVTWFESSVKPDSDQLKAAIDSKL